MKERNHWAMESGKRARRGLDEHGETEWGSSDSQAPFCSPGIPPRLRHAAFKYFNSNRLFFLSHFSFAVYLLHLKIRRLCGSSMQRLLPFPPRRDVSQLRISFLGRLPTPRAKRHMSNLKSPRPKGLYCLSEALSSGALRTHAWH